MGDLGVESRALSIKRYERDKLVALAEIQSREIRILEIDLEKSNHRKNLEENKRKMADITCIDPKNPLALKKSERDRTSMMVHIQSTEIRLLELDEEVDRCKKDIEAQKKHIAFLEMNVKQQQDLLAKGQ